MTKPTNRPLPARQGGRCLPQRDGPFRAYIASFLETIRGLRYADLVQIQPAPHATVYHGAGGAAYALMRAGQRRQAGRWLGDALADRRSAAFAWEYAAPATSYHYGRAGLHWVHALTDDPAAVSRYLRLARRARGIEFMDGAAGHLTGARLLLGRHDDRRLRRVGATLAARLRRRLRARGARPWRAVDAAGGFAHDWTGVFHALLEWSRARGEAPPPWLLASLQRLAAVWSPRTLRRPGLAGAWCQGAAGALLLWCSAYATTNDPPFLRCAREAGRIALAAEYATPDLCCGSAGAAFSLLELERIDPEHGWRQGARELGLRAVRASGLHWPYGLLRGHAGLVCLALDLVAERPAGFPTIFGSETRPRGLVSRPFGETASHPDRHNSSIGRTRHPGLGLAANVHPARDRMDGPNRMRRNSECKKATEV